MKINLNKDIPIKSAYLYLKIKRYKKREDMQNFIKGINVHALSKLVKDRIQEYLRQVGIYDSVGSLTKEGSKLRDEGLFAIREEGKYQVWYTENDSFFGNKIFALERVDAVNYDRYTSSAAKINLSFNNTIHYDINNQEYTEFQIISNGDLYGELLDIRTVLKVEWNWEELNKSYYNFRGKLENKYSRDKKVRIIECYNISVEKNLFHEINILFTKWDSQYKRIALSFDDIKDKRDVITTFQLRTLHIDSNNKYNFKGKAENILVMPNNLSSANLWAHELLLSYIIEDYRVEEDFDNKQSEIKQYKAFEKYANNLNIYNIIDYAPRIREYDRVAYWHLQAPQDLMPDVNNAINTRQVLQEFNH